MRLPCSRRRPVSLVFAVIGCAIAVPACSLETPGEAAPAGAVSTPADDPTTTTRSTTTTSSSTTAPDGPLADTSPCDLVGAQDRVQLGLKSAPDQRKLAYGRLCRFNEDEANLLVSVTIFDTLGLDRENGGAKDRQPVPPIGRHQAQRWMFGDLCTFSLAVGTTSTVDATAGDADGNDQRSCETAMKLAQLVEPKLP